MALSPRVPAYVSVSNLVGGVDGRGLSAILLASAAGAALAVALPSPVSAACSPAAPYSNAAIVCTGATTLNVSAGTVSSITQAGSADVLNITGGAFTNTNAATTVVNQGAGADRAFINGVNIVGVVEQGASNDEITVGANITKIDQGTGANIATINSGSIRQLVQGTGVDVVTVNNGLLEQIVQAGGDDVYLQSGGDVRMLDQGSGADSATVHVGSIIDALLQDSGTDTATINGGRVTTINQGSFGDVLTLSGGTIGAVEQGTGNDSATVGGVAAVTGLVSQGDGLDAILLTAGTLGTLDQGGDYDTAIISGGHIVGAFRDGDDVTFSGGRIGEVMLVKADNIFRMSGLAIVDSSVSSDEGADDYQISGGSIGTFINTGSNADRVAISGGASIGSHIDLEAGDDILMLSAGQIGASIVGGEGDDVIELAGGAVGGSVYGDSSATNAGGRDAITLRGATVAGSIYGGRDNDVLSLNAGRAVAVGGDAGDDIITLAGASISVSVSGGDGDDSFEWTAGSLGSFIGGAGSDRAMVSGGAYAGAQVLDGGDDASTADGQIDILTLQGGVLAANGATILNWEIVKLVGTTGTLSRIVTTELNVCGASTRLLGASVVNGDILGCAKIDDITLADSTVIGGDVEGAGGADLITVTGAAQVSGAIYGDNPGLDASGALAGGDTIRLPGAATVGEVFGQAGDDLIVLDGARIRGSVVAGQGADKVELVTGAVLGSVYGDELVGTVGGDDKISLNGAVVGNGIAAGHGDDSIILASGRTGAVAGQDGDDLVRWASVAASIGTASGTNDGYIDGGEGSDDLEIEDRALQLSAITLLSGGDNTLASDGSVDVLRLNDAWSGALQGAAVANWEDIEVNGGRVSFSDGMIATSLDGGHGLRIRLGGALDATNALAVTGNVLLEASTLQVGAGLGGNVATISGSLSNPLRSTVDLGAAAPGDQLNVAGDYVGGGAILFGVALDDSGSQADRLSVAGDTTGVSTIVVSRVAGTGAQTRDGGIKLIDIGGASNGEFLLDGGSLVVGAWDYRLLRNGLGADAADGDWYLRSSLSAAAQVRTPYAKSLLGFSAAAGGALDARIGDCSITMQLTADRRTAVCGEGVWARATGVHAAYSARRGASYDQDVGLLQGGYQASVFEGRGGALLIGAMATLGKASSDVQVSQDPTTFAARTGAIRTTGVGGGINLTWLGDEGLYADAVGQLTWFDSDLLSSGDLGVRGAGALGSGLSLEAGRRFVSGSWVFVPHGRLAYTAIDFDNFSDASGVETRLHAGDSLIARGGVDMARTTALGPRMANRLRLHGSLNLDVELAGNTAVDVGDTRLEQAKQRVWGEVGGGVTYAMAGRVRLFGEGAYGASLGAERSDRWRGSVGAKFAW